jgi:predicted MFS family arabinose efflux permease
VVPRRGGGRLFVTSTRSGALANRIPRRRLVFAASVLMAALVAVLLNATQSVVVAVVLFCLVGLAAGVRTPTSGGLGLEQVPNHAGAMMGARTAATQFGYLLGAVLGGAVIAGSGCGRSVSSSRAACWCRRGSCSGFTTPSSGQRSREGAETQRPSAQLDLAPSRR